MSDSAESGEDSDDEKHGRLDTIVDVVLELLDLF
jgi:hypothetical protein